MSDQIDNVNPDKSSSVPSPAKRTAAMALQDDSDDERDDRSNRKIIRKYSDNEDDDADNDQENSSAVDDTMDSSFFDVLVALSKLEFPETSDQCPICSQSFTLSKLAEHVYQCINSLDDVEQEQLLKADEKLARELQDQENMTANQTDMLSKFSPPVVCPDGSSCKRTNAQHFISLYHPRVDCPICAAACEVYEIDAHVTLCLTKPPPPKFDSKSMFSSSSSSSSDFTSPAFTNIREPSKPAKQRSVDSDVLLNDNKDDEDDEENSQARPRNNLTLQQASAMASLVVEQRSKGAAQQDYSLTELLDTFKTLGFTQQNLTQLLNQEKSKSPPLARSTSAPE